MAKNTPLKSRIVGSGVANPAELLANPKNWRLHPEVQAKGLEAVLKEVGWVQQVIVNQRSGLLVDGHLRVEVARKRGETEVPVVYVDLSDEEEAKILATLDPLGTLAVTDNEALVALVAAIETQDQDLQALLDSLCPAPEPEGDAEGGLTDPDDAPDVGGPSVSRKGDVWLLAKHRVMCGSATEAEDVKALMAGELAHCLWTDPPYGVSYSQKTRDLPTLTNHRDILNDELVGGGLVDFLTDALTNAIAHMRGGAGAYIAHADGTAVEFQAAVAAAGIKRQGNVIWVKSQFTLGRMDYQQQHEPILYGWKAGTAHVWHGGRKERSVMELVGSVPGLSVDQEGNCLVTLDGTAYMVQPVAKELDTSVLRFPKPHKADLHPTMKPVALVQRMVENSTQPGDLVLDLFGGSGSTLIACSASGRCARMMELDPRYVDVIVKRWQLYTGKQATREADGVLFDSLVETSDAQG
jgi:DNA modification methylase